MIIEDKEAVIEEVPAASDPVIEQPSEDTDPATGTPEPTEETPTEEPEVEAVDPATGRPWKIVAQEWQRKHGENVDRLPQIVEEALQRVQAPKPAEKQYTIEELEQIAMANPHLRPQVEAEKAKLMEQRIEAKNQQFLQGIEKKQQDAMVRAQSEQWVSNHPKFKECFVDTPNGKQWNMAHPLSQAIAQTMNNPEIKGRPDALAVAARVAYGDYMLAGEPKVKTQIKTLQQTVRKEQKKTLPEGGGQTGAQTTDDFTKARDELRQTGSRRSAEKAVSQFLKKAGIAQ